MLARQLDAHGEQVALVRDFGKPTEVEATGLRARVTMFAPDETAGGTQQGGRKVVLSAEDVGASALEAPEMGDRLRWAGKTLAVMSVDGATMRVGGETVAYILRVSGA
jgi:hypothetical protein